LSLNAEIRNLTGVGYSCGGLKRLSLKGKEGERMGRSIERQTGPVTSRGSGVSRISHAMMNREGRTALLEEFPTMFC